MRSANEVRTTTLTSRALGGDPARRRDAVDAGHREVHEHDVGPQADRRLDALLAVRRARDDLDALDAVDHPA